MGYLLDTHTLLWFLENNPKLSSSAKKIIEETEENISISIASLWEITIKINMGKLTLAGSFDTLLNELKSQDINVINISQEHLLTYLNLPLHHRDPFDRMIIAQAIVQEAILIGTDNFFDSYSLKRIW